MAERRAMNAVSGDVFLISIGTDHVVVGQIVGAKHSSRQVWVAIYWPPIDADRADEIIPELISTPPVLLGQTLDAFLKDGRWRRLATTDVIAPIQWPAFKVAAAPGVFHVVDHDGVSHRLATDDEVAVLPFRSTISPAGIEMAVAALAGTAEWNEAFNKLRPGPNTEAAVLGMGRAGS
jgi:hypothetical protein